MRGRVIAYFLFSKRRPSAILDFHIFAIFMKNSNLRLFLRHPTKFGEDRTMRGRVIAYFQFSKWRPSAILDLVWHHSGPRIVFDGPNILLKLHVDHIYILWDIAIFIFDPFGLKLPIHPHFGSFGDMMGFPLELGIGARSPKTRMRGYQTVEKSFKIG